MRQDFAEKKQKGFADHNIVVSGETGETLL